MPDTDPPLPGVIEWRCPPAWPGATLVLLTSLPTRPLESRGGNGETNAVIVRHYIPYGADAWRLVRWPEMEWRPLAALPASWRQFLEGR